MALEKSTATEPAQAATGGSAAASPLDAFTGDIISPLYALGLAVVAFAMVLLPTVYIALIVFTGWLVMLHLTHDDGNRPHQGLKPGRRHRFYPAKWPAPEGGGKGAWEEEMMGQQVRLVLVFPRERRGRNQSCSSQIESRRAGGIVPVVDGVCGIQETAA